VKAMDTDYKHSLYDQYLFPSILFVFTSPPYPQTTRSPSHYTAKQVSRLYFDPISEAKGSNESTWLELTSDKIAYKRSKDANTLETRPRLLKNESILRKEEGLIYIIEGVMLSLGCDVSIAWGGHVLCLGVFMKQMSRVEL